MISGTSSPSPTNDVEVIDIVSNLTGHIESQALMMFHQVSESEMSSVYDEPPKKGKGGKKRKSDVRAVSCIFSKLCRAIADAS